MSSYDSTISKRLDKKNHPLGKKEIFSVFRRKTILKTIKLVWLHLNNWIQYSIELNIYHNKIQWRESMNVYLFEAKRFLKADDRILHFTTRLCMRIFFVFSSNLICSLLGSQPSAAFIRHVRYFFLKSRWVYRTNSYAWIQKQQWNTHAS